MELANLSDTWTKQMVCCFEVDSLPWTCHDIKGRAYNPYQIAYAWRACFSTAFVNSVSTSLSSSSKRVFVLDFTFTKTPSSVLSLTRPTWILTSRQAFARLPPDFGLNFDYRSCSFLLR